MFPESVAATIVIVVVISVSFPVPPMSIVMVAVVFVFALPFVLVLVFICKGCVSWKHEESENDDRKRFSSFQRFPPKWVSYVSRLTCRTGSLKVGRRHCFLGASTLPEAIWMLSFARISHHNPRECIGGPALSCEIWGWNRTAGETPALRNQASYLREIFPETRRRKLLPRREAHGGSCRRRSRREAGCYRSKPCGARRADHVRI